MNSSETFGSERRAAIIASLVIEVITHASIAVVVAMRNVWPLRQPSPKN